MKHWNREDLEDCSSEEDYIVNLPKKNVQVYRKTVDNESYVIKKVKMINEGTEVKMCEHIMGKDVKLKHLVKIFDVWRNKIGTHYFIMMEGYPYNLQDYLSKKENRDRIRKNPALGMQIFLQICYGLAQLPVAHRDLKSSNILLKEFRQNEKLRLKVVLADFAECNRGECLNDSRVGTLFYMAPEIKKIRNQNNRAYNSHKVDIWSLGVITCQIFPTPNPQPNVGVNNLDNSKSKILTQFPKGINQMLEKDKLNEDQYKNLCDFIEKNPPIISASIPKPMRDIIEIILNPVSQHRLSLAEILEYISQNREIWKGCYPQYLPSDKIKQIGSYLSLSQTKELNRSNIRITEKMCSLYHNFYLPVAGIKLEEITHFNTILFIYYGLKTICEWFTALEKGQQVKRQLLMQVIFGGDELRFINLERLSMELKNRLLRKWTEGDINKFFMNESRQILVGRESITNALRKYLQQQVIMSLYDEFLNVYEVVGQQ